ncbi:MAG: glycosyltransferase family 4 protein [Thermoproteus sp.]
MRVALISSGLVPVPPKRGGAVELYVYYLVKELRKQGIEAYVIDRDWDSNEQIYENDFMLRIPLRNPLSLHLDKLLGKRKKILEELSFGFEVLKYLRNFDIVHANTAWAGYVIAIKKRELNNARLVYTCHNGLWTEEKVHLGEKVIRYVEGYIMRKVDVVIALNNTMKRALVKKAGISLEKVVTIPNGVDVEFYRPGIECSEVAQKLSLQGKYVVLFVGRISSEKGVHILLKALKILKDRYGLRDVKTLIVGPLSGTYGSSDISPYAKELMKYVRQEHLDVIFFGDADPTTLRKIYSCSHIFVLPSLFEAFPMVLLEAMASGLPVIGSRAGGIPDIIKDGVNGLLFEKGSPEDLAEKLSVLLTNDSLRREMGRESRRITEEKYSWQKVAEKILYTYKALS